MPFTGRYVSPSVTEVKAVMQDGSEKTLTQGQFTVDYENNVKAGTAKMIIRAVGGSGDGEAVSCRQEFRFKIVNQK